jgi:hypothetical protein
VSGTHLGPATNFSHSLLHYFLDSFRFVDVGRPLWREVGSVLFSFCRDWKKSLKLKSCYDWRSVSHYVLVSSSLWNLWPDIILCLKVAVFFLWGALSDERSDLSPVSHCHQCLVHCQRFNIIYIVQVTTCFKYMQYILDLCQHRLSTADHATMYATTDSFWVIYKNSDRASQKTSYVSAIKINWLMLYRETVAIYFEQNEEF